MSKSISGLSKISDKVQSASHTIDIINELIDNEKIVGQLIQDNTIAAFDTIETCNNGTVYYQNYEGGCILATGPKVAKVFEIHGIYIKNGQKLAGKNMASPSQMKLAHWRISAGIIIL